MSILKRGDKAPKIPDRIKIQDSPQQYAIDIFNRFQDRLKGMVEGEVMIGVAVYLSALKENAPEKYLYVLETIEELGKALSFGRLESEKGGDINAP